ncbi:MAG: CHAP domain-containing protein [Desulfobacterales bacterium]|nr:CHAP domain-containing protein [Desulfobacterales bacterium]
MDPYSTLINTAAGFVGVTEEGGDNRGPWVEEFQKAVDGVANHESWCCCFASYCLKQTAYLLDRVLDLNLSEHCLTFWNHNIHAQRDFVEPGFLVVWKHGNGPNGHIGIVESVNGDGTITTIEGNTSDSSSVERNGDGVYRKVRSLTPKGSMKIVGFIDPWS